MIDGNLLTFMVAQTVITDITTAERIWREKLPAKPDYPAITFKGDHELDNTFDGNNGFTKSDYTIDAWATSQAGAVTLSNAIRSALKNVTGAFGGINIHQCFITSGPVTVFEESVNVYRQSQIFSIWHNEG